MIVYGLRVIKTNKSYSLVCENKVNTQPHRKRKNGWCAVKPAHASMLWYQPQLYTLTPWNAPIVRNSEFVCVWVKCAYCWNEVFKVMHLTFYYMSSELIFIWTFLFLISWFSLVLGLAMTHARFRKSLTFICMYNITPVWLDIFHSSASVKACCSTHKKKLQLK